MEITVKFKTDDIKAMLQERLSRDFPGVTFKIEASSYYNSGMVAESVDPVEETRKEAALKAYREQASLQLEPSDVAILVDLQKEADAF